MNLSWTWTSLYRWDNFIEMLRRCMNWENRTYESCVFFSWVWFSRSVSGKIRTNGIMLLDQTRLFHILTDLRSQHYMHIWVFLKHLVSVLAYFIIFLFDHSGPLKYVGGEITLKFLPYYCSNWDWLLNISNMGMNHYKEQYVILQERGRKSFVSWGCCGSD